MVIILKNYSIWKDGVKSKKYPNLEKDINVDVLIIGGGITGVSSLYFLKDSGLKVALVEQNRIGCGVTSNSTGKLNFMQDSLYEKIIKNHGIEKAKLYLKSQIDGINDILSIIKSERLNCDLKKVPAYVCSNDYATIEKMKKFKKFLNDNGIDTFNDKCDLVVSKYLFGVNDTYIFNPFKFVIKLAQKCYKENIFENTSIIKIDSYLDGYMCYTDKFVIKAKWVILASHYPYFNLPFMFPIKGYLEKSYLSAVKYQGKDVSLITYNKPTISMRNYKDYLVYLSNSHSVGIKVDDKKNFEELEKKLKDLNLVPEYLWSNMDIITNDGLPYIGEIKDRLLLGTGYNTWGLINGVIAGKIMSDILSGNDNEYIDLFYTKRKNLAMITSSVIDGIVSLFGYVNGCFGNNNRIEYKKIKGKEVAIYKDADGTVHSVYTKCPHMGCRLLFNEVEKTWDCPCHASRFDIDGKCISGPANRSITFDYED